MVENGANGDKGLGSEAGIFTINSVNRSFVPMLVFFYPASRGPSIFLDKSKGLCSQGSFLFKLFQK